jgi:hypothetical protein
MGHLLPRATALAVAVLSVSLSASAAGAVAQAGNRVPATSAGGVSGCQSAGR